MLIENMAMAFHAIRANRMRSFLTMLGIIIGIGSVISIVSIGDTMRSMFEDLYNEVGITQAYVYVGYWVEDRRMSDYYTIDELEQIRSVFDDEIAYMDMDSSTKSQVSAGRTAMDFNFTGIDHNYRDVQPLKMVSGRFLDEGDILGRKKNVVMEAKSAKKLFGTEDAVGKTFRTTLFGYTDEYTVVGVYEKEMSAFMAFMMGSDDSVGSAFIPWSILTWPNDYIYSCHLYAKSDVDMKDFMDRLTAYIARIKGREPEDFQVSTALDEMESVDGVMGALSAAVGGIAAISLLVGGIGIMNIMLVSVTERTREIGIRKALGARTRDVLLQFLTESAILSACGGALGVLLASGILFTGGYLLRQAVVIRPAVVVLAVSFSAAVGVFFGLYPALKAAKADPITALRYE